MTAIINVTHNGLSQDIPADVPFDICDGEVRRIAVEALEVRPDTFINFVVDRFDTPEGGKRIFLRPKVPFG